MFKNVKYNFLSFFKFNVIYYKVLYVLIINDPVEFRRMT